MSISAKKLVFYFIAGLTAFLSRDGDAQSAPKRLQADTIRLSGNWFFQTDPKDIGVNERWYDKKLTGQIKLPGSMTSNHLGNDISVHTPWTGGIEDSSWFHKPEYAAYRKQGNIKIPFWLQPEKYYKGVAWYQKTIVVPAGWRGKSAELFIERAHWTSAVYLDNTRLGSRNSLGSPHRYYLEALTPGKHILSVSIDNRINEINVGINSHSISDHTQGNWNGMVGRMYLAVKPRVYIEDIQLFPDIDHGLVNARVAIRKTSKTHESVTLHFRAALQQGGPALPAIVRKVSLTRNMDTINILYKMGVRPQLWSEHHPSLYRMQVDLISDKDRDSHSVLFGMRKFSEKGTQFTINGHPVMLRGTLDCAAFPLTGFPPTDLNSWLRILKTCKAFGLNHIRFHSWCPPEAAFEAGDRLGFYFQIECSSWANQGAVIGDGRPLDKFIHEESENIVRAYGNHPSFCLMDYGNEPAGKHQTEYLANFVKFWKAKDPRRLYTTGSGWPVITDADYNSTPDPRIQHWGEGLKSILNGHRPFTDYNWADIISKWQHPTVSHEIGQWCVYPDFKEISQYTGVMKAHNFEIFRDQLTKNGLGALGEKFLNASGRLQTLCYKADIEAALRTKGFGGFQLLGLEDFPGQGTALVGVLNVFYRPKDYISPGIYTQFCNDVVPLARFPKMVYLNSERLEIPVEIAQFSERQLQNIKTGWKVTDAGGKVLFSGAFEKRNIPEGNGISLGTISQALKSILQPKQLTLTVQVDKYANSWQFFVYPGQEYAKSNDVIVTDRLTPEIISSLDKGGKVLLTLKKGTLKSQYGGNVAIGFSSIFWNTAWTHGQAPETLGILCDPKHPALKYFPTASYSDYQWWDAMSHSSPIMLDSVAKGVVPVVRAIDDWVKARSLSLLFECRIGKGKMMVSGIDLLTDAGNRVEARQLMHSLQLYMESAEFKPNIKVDIARIKALYNENN